MLFQDSDRVYHVIESCPITNLSSLQECFAELGKNNDLLIDSAEIQSLLCLIATLSGVDIELLKKQPSELLEAIAELNFPTTENTENSESKENKEVLSISEYADKLVVRLVNTELSTNLTEALAIASTVPHTQLENYLIERVNFLNRDEIEKKKKEEEEQKELKEFEDSITDGSFFDGFQEAFINQLKH